MRNLGTLFVLMALLSACSTTEKSQLAKATPEETLCQENIVLCTNYPDLFKPGASSNCEGSLLEE